MARDAEDGRARRQDDDVEESTESEFGEYQPLTNDDEIVQAADLLAGIMGAVFVAVLILACVASLGKGKGWW